MRQPMQPWMHDVPRAIVSSKRYLRGKMADLKARYAVVEAALRQQVQAVRDEARGAGAVPELDYAGIAGGSVTQAQRDRIRARGCVVVRSVFDSNQIAGWNEEIGEYIARNHYIERTKSKAGIDKYFSALADGRPQIYGLYWSRPQVLAR